MPFALLVGGRAGEVISNLYVKQWRSTGKFFDSRNFKFRRVHARHRCQVGLHLLKKVVTARYDRAAKSSLKRFDSIFRPEALLLNRKQRTRLKRCVQKLCQNAESGCARLERSAPFVEEPHDFKRILFRDVFIRARSNLSQHIIDGRFCRIVRRNSKIGKLGSRARFAASLPKERSERPRVNWRRREKHWRPAHFVQKSAPRELLLIIFPARHS